MFCCSEAYPVRGRIIEVGPSEHYSYVNDDFISHENVLRIKFLGLGLFKLVAFSPLQIAYRIYDLFTGGSFYRGYERAEHEHRCDMKDNPHFRERFAPMGKVVEHVLSEFFCNVGLLVLYPFYLTALIFASLVGSVCPELARRIFSHVEPIFYVAPVDPFAEVHWLEKYGNLAAPCMQTTEFRMASNLFRYEKENYHPETSRSLCNRLKHLMEKASAYFSMDEMRSLREAVEAGERSIREIAITDIREVRALRNQRPVSDRQEKLRRAFLTSLNTLEDAIDDWTQRCGNYRERLQLAVHAFS